MSAESLAVNPLAFFKEELGSEELKVRVNAIHRVPLVVQLVANNTALKEQLLVILDGVIESKEDDDDEVLFGLARSLPALNGFYSPNKLLPLFEKLLLSEETIVREKTVDSFLAMAKGMERPVVASVVVPFVIKLTGNQSFGSKMSVLSIMTELFPLLSQEEKAQILEKIGQLFTEESLILRRNLASKIGKICKYLSKETLNVEIFNHFKNLTNDDSDSVRIITIESLVELAHVFNEDENKQLVIPLIIQMTGDKSWRVKLHLAKNFAKLAEAVKRDVADTSLINIFSTLLRDPENEVRIAAVRSLKNFVCLLSGEKVVQILAYLQSLAKDPVALVKTGVCEVVQTILQMDQDQNHKEGVRHRVQQILIDLSAEKDKEVRIETFKILPLWTRSMGTSIFDLLSNGTINLNTESPNWHIRFALIDCYLSIALQLKNPKLFDKHVKKWIVAGMADKCYKIRKHITSSISSLATFLDDTMLYELFFKEYQRVALDPSQFYTFRISALYGLEETLIVLRSKDKLKDSFSKTLFKACEDSLINVRYVAVKIICDLCKKGIVLERNDLLISLLIKAKSNETDKEVIAVLERFLKG